jgi:hypothetical protein
MTGYAPLVFVFFLGSCALVPRPCLLGDPCPCQNSYKILDEGTGRLIEVYQSPHFDSLFDACSCKRRLHPTGARVAFLSQGEVTDACRASAEIHTGFYRPVLGQEAITILRNAAGEVGANAVVLEFYEPGRESIGRAYHCSPEFLAALQTTGRGGRQPTPDERRPEQIRLIWQECSYGQAAGPPCGGAAQAFPREAATRYCADLRLDGRSWRLPTIDELRSIVDHSVPEGQARINAQRFPNTRRHVYWSSTPYAQDPNVNQVVDFDTGADYGYARENPGFVRCVSEMRP